MKKNRKVVVSCGVAGVIVLACVLAALHRAGPQPPSPQTAAPEQVVEYLASSAFVKMAPAAKQAYIEEIRVPGSETPVMSLLSNPSVPEEQRRRVMENVMPVVGPVIAQRLNEFDQLPLAERNARLDAFIDQLQKGRQGNQGMMSSVERMNLVLQYVDPHTRAEMRKHIPTLLSRMKERGIKGVPLW